MKTRVCLSMVALSLCFALALPAFAKKTTKPAPAGFWADSRDDVYHLSSCTRAHKPLGEQLVTGSEADLLRLGYYPDPACLPNRSVATRAGRLVRVEGGAFIGAPAPVTPAPVPSVEPPKHPLPGGFPSPTPSPSAGGFPGLPGAGAPAPPMPAGRGTGAMPPTDRREVTAIRSGGMSRSSGGRARTSSGSARSSSGGTRPSLGGSAQSGGSRGSCPKGGNHSAGKVDKNGRSHCSKCGRFM